MTYEKKEEKPIEYVDYEVSTNWAGKIIYSQGKGARCTYEALSMDNFICYIYADGTESMGPRRMSKEYEQSPAEWPTYVRIQKESEQ